MGDPDLPHDLISSLASAAGRSLDTGLYGVVSLVSAEDLRAGMLEVTPTMSPFARDDPHRHDGGCYLVPAVNLVAGDPRSAVDFPAWLLLWLPAERRYGSFDLDHGDVLMFAAEVRWSDITADPAAYVSASEGGGRGPRDVEYLKPWPKYPYRPERGAVPPAPPQA